MVDRGLVAGRNGAGAGLVTGTEGGEVVMSGSGSVATGPAPATDTTVRDAAHETENPRAVFRVEVHPTSQGTRVGIARCRTDAALGPHRPHAEVRTTMMSTAAVWQADGSEACPQVSRNLFMTVWGAAGWCRRWRKPLRT